MECGLTRGVTYFTAEQMAWLVEVETEASGWLGESVAAYTAFTVSRWPRMVRWSSKMGWLVVLAMGMLIEALFLPMLVFTRPSVTSRPSGSGCRSLGVKRTS